MTHVTIQLVLMWFINKFCQTFEQYGPRGEEGSVAPKFVLLLLLFGNKSYKISAYTSLKILLFFKILNLVPPLLKIGN
jgi:hypothetical protein